MLTCPIFSDPGILQTGAQLAALTQTRMTRQMSIFNLRLGTKLNKKGRRKIRSGFTATKAWNEFRHQWNSHCSLVYITVVFFFSIPFDFVMIFNKDRICLEKVFWSSFQSPKALFCRRGRVEDGSVNRVLSWMVSGIPTGELGNEPLPPPLFRGFQGQKTKREAGKKTRITCSTETVMT